MTKKCPICKNSTPTVTFYGKSRLCTNCQKTYMANYRAKSRLETLLAYGGQQPKCACPGCDENRLPFLTIDHTNNDGGIHRKSIAPTKGLPPGGGVIFRWLKKNNYPPGYQVMCYNCNMAKGTSRCPVHQPSTS